MKQPRRQVHRVIFALLCVMLLCTSVLAASCSLRVTLLDEEQKPISDISVEVCQVARREGESFVLTEEFAGLGLSSQELTAPENTVEAAQQTFQYLLAKELEGMIVPTGERGWADFTELEEGIYLVFERGGQIVSFQPYLVALPTEQDGQIYYNIHSTPKAVSPDSKSILVMKQWEDDDNAARKRPGHIEVTLYRDGAPIRTVVLNERCDWQHTFHMLPGEGEYTVEETAVRGYETSYEEVAEGFVIVNTYVPSGNPSDPPGKPDKPELPDVPDEPQAPQEPQEPELPQTGFRMWPVYALLICGTALVLWGLVEVCLGREET